MANDDDDKPRWIVTRRTVEDLFMQGTPMTFINADTLSLGGHPVEIDSEVERPDEHWDDAILICGEVSSLAGSVIAACDECAVPIAHMAHAPTKLKRVCLRCAKRLGAFK